MGSMFKTSAGGEKPKKLPATIKEAADSLDRVSSEMKRKASEAVEDGIRHLAEHRDTVRMHRAELLEVAIKDFAREVMLEIGDATKSLKNGTMEEANKQSDKSAQELSKSTERLLNRIQRIYHDD